MLLCGECYENVYNERRTNYPLFKVLNNLTRGTDVCVCVYSVYVYMYIE
jgi:hypothetical protein